MCHVQGGIAPFSLTTYDAIKVQAPAVRNAVTTRIMPPWLATSGCTDYQDDRSLSDDQIALIKGWIDEGMREGDAADYKAPQVIQRGLTRVDNSLAMPIVYTPKLSPDEYRCFMIDWPYATEKFVTGFNTKPGNPTVVHHVIAYVAPPAQVAMYQALDDADPEPGYPCFGGPGGDFRNGLPGMIGAWAPGGQGGDFPAGTGLRMQPGSKIILQMHYNTLNNPPAPDQTSIEVKVDDTVDKPAAMMFWTNPQWVLNHTMDIPAGQQDVMKTFSGDMTTYTSILSGGQMQSGKPLTIYSAALHQHLRGTRSRLDLTHADGTSECLLNIDRWNFHWQIAYPFVAQKQIMPGDMLNITCHWDNSAAGQPFVGNTQLPATDINWGEGSTDEMCLGAIYATE
jgi:hypothetical protein